MRCKTAERLYLITTKCSDCLYFKQNKKIDLNVFIALFSIKHAGDCGETRHSSNKSDNKTDKDRRHKNEKTHLFYE